MREFGVYMIVTPRQEKKIFKTFSPVFERDIITECDASFNMYRRYKGQPCPPHQSFLFLALARSKGSQSCGTGRGSLFHVLCVCVCVRACVSVSVRLSVSISKNKKERQKMDVLSRKQHVFQKSGVWCWL